LWYLNFCPINKRHRHIPEADVTDTNVTPNEVDDIPKEMNGIPEEVNGIPETMKL
jgi:hypothetical protein